MDTQADLLTLFCRRAAVDPKTLPAALGVTRQTVWAWLNGRQAIKREHFPALMRALDLSKSEVGWLVLVPVSK